jgi:hypothetical protein
MVTVIAGCNHETRTTEPAEQRERPGLFTLYTNLGAVDVLAFEQQDGHRSVRLHAVYPDGHHAVRTIKVDVIPDPARPDQTQVVESVWNDGSERFRITRNLTENATGLDATYASGHESLRFIASTQGTQVRFQAQLDRSGDTRTWEKTLDPARASNTTYVASVRASFADFYGSGPFRENEDLALLIAVEESDDWGNYLTETPIGIEGGGQTQTERNIHRVCTAANVIGKVSCFAARFTPWAMIGCIPATGITLTCLAYNVYQLTTSPDPLPPPPPCTCGCPCNRGD